MKKYRIGIFVLLVSLFACNKSENESPSTARGELTERTFLLQVTKNNIQLAMYQLAFDYANDVNYTYNVDLYKIKYYTINTDGTPVIASGLIVIPSGSTANPLPMVSYQHGTILKKDDVPSRLKGSYEVALVFATEGYVAVCPDYLGLGDGEKLHPYLHAKTEASATIDLLKAAKQFCNEKGTSLNSQLFLLGYSQGGHATMATLQAIEEDSDHEFNVTACAPMAGPYDLSGTQMNYMLRDSAYPTPGYLPYMLFAYNNIYHFFNNPNEIFVSPFDTQFPAYFGDNPTQTLGAVDALWPEGDIPNSVLKPDVIAAVKTNPNYSMNLALKENDLYNWAPKTPIRLCHCDNDKHVPYQNSVVAYNYFIQNGSTDVELINPLPGGNHTSCSVPSMIYALKWFNTLKN